MTRKILITYKGKSSQPKQRSGQPAAGYSDYWGEVGPDRPKKRQVHDGDVGLPVHLQRAIYSLEYRASELADQPEWQAECLTAAAALKKLRTSLIEAGKGAGR